MKGEGETALIVGLGNPGKKYQRTRHNLGWEVVRAFAQKEGWAFKKKWRLKGEVALGNRGEKKVIALLPTTYMNLCGIAVKAACRFYSVKSKNVLVVVDDVTLSFGKFRYRTKGSAGGHNGLKSIEAHLKTEEYSRLKIGVGNPEKGEDLASYVLTSFKGEERGEIPRMIELGEKCIISWLDSESITLNEITRGSCKNRFLQEPHKGR